VGAGENFTVTGDNVSDLMEKLQKTIRQMPDFDKLKNQIEMTVGEWSPTRPNIPSQSFADRMLRKANDPEDPSNRPHFAHRAMHQQR
jgi:hypothetical protein